MPRPAVRYTEDFARIEGIPRREPTLRDAEAWAETLTPEVRCAGADVRLRPWQAFAIGEALDNAQTYEVGAFLGLPVGFGKAQPNTEPVLTPSGWREIGSLRVGDLVFGSSGRPVRVLGVYPQGKRKIVRANFSDNSWALCDEEHLWTLEAGDRNPSTRTAKEWSAARLTRKCGEHVARIWWLPRHAPIQFPHTKLPLDPYTLGALIGDGSFRHGSFGFTSADDEICGRLVLPGGLKLQQKNCQNAGKATEYKISGPGGRGSNALINVLRSLELWGTKSREKFIPRVYRLASVEQRAELLRGLFDTDGYAATSSIEYCTVSLRLCMHVVELVESLGGIATVCERPVPNGLAYRLNVRLPKGFQAFHLSRKREAHEAQARQREPRRALASIEPWGEAECTCIRVDAEDSLYVTRSHILTHNTLPMYVLSRLLGAVRPLVIVPGRGLAQKTAADFSSYTGRWKAPATLPRIVTHELLSTEGAEFFFDGGESSMRPDVVFLEEADEWANPEAAASRRLDRYLAANNGVLVYALTGTPTRKSLLTYGHILRWCLRELAPVPTLHSELAMWARAIDDFGGRDSTARRPSPGPLGETVAEARAWYASRLRETPGVVLIDGDSAGDVPLVLTQRLVGECPKLDEHYKIFSRAAVLDEDPEDVPDGLVFSDPLSKWRIDGQLQCGYFLRYVAPGPPQEWREAKREKDRFVREVIAATSRDDRPLDTELQVSRRFHDAPEFVEWRRLCAEFGNAFPTEPVWVSDVAIKTVLAWLRESTQPGVIWCGGVEFARALVAVTGLSYYGREGLDQNGRALHAADPSKSLIASWHANMKGFNLQAFTRACLTQGPQSAKFREQIYGRHHRAGVRDPVEFTEIIGSGGGLDAFEAAISEAQFAKSTVGLTQKILRARIVRATPKKTKTNVYRWARRD